MFQESVITAYDMTDATWEIVIMLAGAFVLGYVLHYVIHAGAGVITRKTKKQKTTGTIPAKYASFKVDDLKIIEGIGPKIEELLQNNNVRTWSDLAGTKAERLREILTTAGERFAMHDPQSWPDQAALARDGKWKELEEFQDLLLGGHA